MIKSFSDYQYYFERDRIARGMPDNVMRPRFGRDVVWRWQRTLRTLEYVHNCKKGPFWSFIRLALTIKFRMDSVKLGFTIPINTFDEGLYIPHYGTIVVHGNARIGKNCRLMEGTNIGDSAGRTPIIGDNCFICTGAKILGGVRIGNNVIVGANAVVIKSVDEDDVTVGGVPAKIISHKNSTAYINERLR